MIYLDLAPSDAATRGDYGAERYEKVDFQEKVRNTFKALADDRWKVGHLEFNCQTKFRISRPPKILDATQTMDSLANEIAEHVDSVLTRNAPLEEGLWQT